MDVEAPSPQAAERRDAGPGLGWFDPRQERRAWFPL